MAVGRWQSKLEFIPCFKWYLSGSRRLKDRVKAQDTGRKVKDLIFRVKGKDLKNKRETICG